MKGRRVPKACVCLSGHFQASSVSSTLSRVWFMAVCLNSHLQQTWTPTLSTRFNSGLALLPRDGRFLCQPGTRVNRYYLAYTICTSGIYLMYGVNRYAGLHTWLGVVPGLPLTCIPWSPTSWGCVLRITISLQLLTCHICSYSYWTRLSRS